MEAFKHMLENFKVDMPEIHKREHQILKRKRWIGDASSRFSTKDVFSDEVVDAKRAVIEAAEVLHKKIRLFEDVRDKKVEEMDAFLDSLMNPAETGFLTVANSTELNCLLRFTREDVKRMMCYLAERSDKSHLLCVEMRRAFGFFDKDAVVDAASSLWGSLAGALARRQLGKIKVAKDAICMAKTVEGCPMALVRTAADTVDIVNLETGEKYCSIHSLVVDTKCDVTDFGALEFTEKTVYAVVNRTRYFCEDGRVRSKTGISPSRYNGDTVRINRFILKSPNAPFYAHVHGIKPKGTESDPFYVTGTIMRWHNITVKVRAGHSECVVPGNDGILDRTSFYDRASTGVEEGVAAEKTLKVSESSSDMLDNSNLDNGFECRKNPLMRVQGSVFIDGIARAGRLLIATLEMGEKYVFHVAILPKRELVVETYVVHTDKSGPYILISGKIYDGYATMVPVTVIARLVTSLTMKNGLKMNATEFFFEMVHTFDTDFVSSVDKIRFRIKETNELIKGIAAFVPPMIVKGRFSGIVEGTDPEKPAYVQFGTAIVEVPAASLIVA